MSFWKNLPQPIIGLAPMDGVTDATYRFITARHGHPDVTFTEFVAVERLVRGYDLDLSELRYSELERPVIAQVFGSDPEGFYRAAHVIAELGFDGIDINMGCPAKSIARRGAGAGLIRTPDLARFILRRTQEGIKHWAEGQGLREAGLPDPVIISVRRARKIWFDESETGTPCAPRKIIPVSVKTRLGYDRVVIHEWIPQLLSEKPAAISLHGRTLTQRYRGAADWEAIRRAGEIVRGSGTLLLGNGDVRSAEEAVQRIRETQVHGVLLGRATLGNPWIFLARHAIRRAVWTGGALPSDPTVTVPQRLSLALEHSRLYHTMIGSRSYRSIRKFLAAYVRGFPNAAAVRNQVGQCNTLTDVESILEPMIKSGTRRVEVVRS